MAISFKQANNAVHTSGNVASLGIAFTSAVVVGDLLVCFVWCNVTTDTITVADNINGSWTSAIAQQNNSTSFACQMFYFPNSAAAAASAMTVTATLHSTSGHIGLQIADFAGVATSSPLDGTPVVTIQSVSNVTTLTSPTLTTTGSSDLLFAGLGTSSGHTSPVAGSGFTIPTNGNNAETAQEYELNVAAGGHTASMSWTTTNHATIILAGFLAAGSSGAISATINGTSSVTAALDGTGAVASTIGGTSSVTTNLTGKGTVAASINGTSSVTAAISGISQIAAVINGTSSVTGAITGTGAVAASINGVGTVTAALAGAGALASIISGIGTVSVNVIGNGALASSISGAGTVSVGLTGSGSLASAILGTSSVTVNVTGGSGAISASIQGTGTVSVGLAGSGALASNISDAGTVAVGLTGSGAVASSILGAGTVTVVLAGKGALASSISDSGSIVVSLTGSGALAPSLQGSGTVSVTLKGTGALASSISDAGLVSVGLTGSGALATAILGTSSVIVDVTGGSGSISVSIQGTGIVSAGLIGSGALVSSIFGNGTVVVNITPLVPPLPSYTPVAIGKGLSSTGVSIYNPSVIKTTSNDVKRFSSESNEVIYLTGIGNTNLFKRSYYAVAVGDIVVPPSAQNVLLNLSLVLKGFSQKQVMQLAVHDDIVAQLSDPQSLSIGTTPWVILCKFSAAEMEGSGNQNNKVGGYLISDYTIKIGDSYFTGTLTSSNNPFIEPVLQFSIGIQFFGSVSGEDVFQANLYQFETQQ